MAEEVAGSGGEAARIDGLAIDPWREAKSVARVSVTVLLSAALVYAADAHPLALTVVTLVVYVMLLSSREHWAYAVSGYLGTAASILWMGEAFPGEAALVAGLLAVLVEVPRYEFGRRRRRSLCAVAGPETRTHHPIVFLLGLLWLAWMGTSIMLVVSRESVCRSRDGPDRARRLAERGAGGSYGLVAALSGGGYRAALFHSGVLAELERNSRHPSHLSMVSGGAIAGAYYAVGGDLERFVDWVGRRPSLLFREAILPRSLLRGLEGLPFRLEAQTEILERDLLGAARLGDDGMPPRVELVVGTTDIVTGVQVGWTPHGYLLSAAPGWASDAGVLAQWFTPRTLRWADLSECPSFADIRLGQVVAASGAFPGAIEPLALPLRLVRSRAEGPRDQVQWRVHLADGGLTDNSGLGLALAAVHDGRNPEGGRPGRWGNVLAVVESDASGRFRDFESYRGLRSLTRVADILFGQATATQRLIHHRVAEAMSKSAPGALEAGILRVSPHRYRAPPPMAGDEYLKRARSGHLGPATDANRYIHERVEERIRRIGGASGPGLQWLRELYSEILAEWVLRCDISRAKVETIERMVHLGQQDRDRAPCGVTIADLLDWQREFHRISGLEAGDARLHHPRMLSLDDPLDEVDRSIKYLASSQPAPFPCESLERVVIDIRGCLDAFDRTSTLADRIPIEDARRIFRLGRYLCLLRIDDIQAALAKAQLGRDRGSSIRFGDLDRRD